MEVDDAIVATVPAIEKTALAGRGVDTKVLAIDRKLNLIKKSTPDFQIRRILIRF